MKDRKKLNCKDEENNNSALDRKQNVNGSSLQINTKRTIIRGCILNASISEEIESNKLFILKVIFFQGDSKRNCCVDTLFHCGKIIHETNVASSLNPVWNSSFLTHLPLRLKQKSDGYFQFVVYCIKKENEGLPRRNFVGQHTLKLDDSSVQGNPERVSLYRWDGRTVTNSEIEVLSDIFWPMHGREVM